MGEKWGKTGKKWARNEIKERFLADIQWPGAAAFARAERSVWRLTPADPEVAG